MKESEIWHIVNALVRGVGILHEMKMPHGDIQPKTVHLTKDGRVHLHNHHFLSAGHSGYYKMITTPGYKAALSPNLLRQLKYKKVKPDHDPIASDLWSIGITILCACTNNEFDRYYDWGNLIVRYDKIKHDFDRMKKIGYKDELIDLLSEILEETEPRRIKFDDVERVLDRIDEERSVMSALSRNSSLRGSMFAENPDNSQYIFVTENDNRPSNKSNHNPLMMNYGGGPQTQREPNPLPPRNPLDQAFYPGPPQNENMSNSIPHQQGFVTPPPMPSQRELTPPQQYDNYNPPIQYQQYENYEPPIQPQNQTYYPQYQEPVQTYESNIQRYPSQPTLQTYSNSKYPYNYSSSKLQPPTQYNTQRISATTNLKPRLSFLTRREKYERDPTQVITQQMISPDGKLMRRSVYTSIGRTIVEEEF